jgi:hypothetical protein
MSNNPNLSIGASNQLAYIENVIKEARALTVDVDLDKCNYSMHTSNHEKPSHNHPKLPDIGDGRCYFPCKKCKGIKRRRINRSTTRKHCLEHGHLEGGTNITPW